MYYVVDVYMLAAIVLMLLIHYVFYYLDLVVMVYLLLDHILNEFEDIHLLIFFLIDLYVLVLKVLMLCDALNLNLFDRIFDEIVGSLVITIFLCLIGWIW
eukprot:1048489_1